MFKIRFYLRKRLIRTSTNSFHYFNLSRILRIIVYISLYRSNFLLKRSVLFLRSNHTKILRVKSSQIYFLFLGSMLIFGKITITDKSHILHIFIKNRLSCRDFRLYQASFQLLKSIGSNTRFGKIESFFSFEIVNIVHIFCPSSTWSPLKRNE